MERHNDRIDQFAASAAAYEKQSLAYATKARAYSYGRLITFLTGLVFVVFIESSPAIYIGALACAVLFIWCFIANKQAQKKQEFLLALSIVNRDSANRILRNWDKLAGINAAADVEQCLYWEDLNVSGEKSLLTLFSRLSSPLGVKTLVGWLSAPAARDVIEQRQAAHQVLAPMLGWRQRVSALSFNTAGSESDLRQLSIAIQHVSKCLRENTRKKLSRALTAWLLCVVGMLALMFFRMLPAEVFLAISAINIGVLLCARKLILSVYGRLNISQKALASLSSLSEAIEQESFEDPYLCDIVRELSEYENSRGFSASLKAFNSLINLSELRFNAIPYALAQILFLWDLCVAFRLISWSKVNRGLFQNGLNRLGEFEAILMLANLAYEHPGWALPRVESDQGQPVVMRNAGHPLFSEDKNVKNSLVIGKDSPIMVITGSHMSGKTTCLRMVGCNSVLALAGGVVCAEEMSLPVVKIATSIHINDSLLDGVSLFMAEIIRIKRIVLQAGQSTTKGGYKTLFLLDEVMRGANDVERQAVVVEILKALTCRDAFGIMSTNDLYIAKSEAIQHFVQHAHFQEEVIEDASSLQQPIECEASDIAASLHFDYLLKPGIVTQTNALKLLKVMTIDSGVCEQLKPQTHKGDIVS